MNNENDERSMGREGDVMEQLSPAAQAVFFAEALSVPDFHKLFTPNEICLKLGPNSPDPAVNEKRLWIVNICRKVALGGPELNQKYAPVVEKIVAHWGIAPEEIAGAYKELCDAGLMELTERMQ